MRRDFGELAQNNILAESSFIRFLKDRGFSVSGIFEGDPGEFLRRGWLTDFGPASDGTPLYHRFQLYVVWEIHKRLDVNLFPIQGIDPGGVNRLSDYFVANYERAVESIENKAPEWNLVAELAVSLEAEYWPRITGRLKFSPMLRDDERIALVRKHRSEIRRIIHSLEPTDWEERHRQLRMAGATLDENHSLYLLLRSCDWSKREKLKGTVSGALWIRHIAEVIRRAFEEHRECNWYEEDRAFGVWNSGAREKIYGADRPLDDLREFRPRVARHFGLFTGSVARWYVEGDTEYGFLKKIYDDPEKYGLEIVNLKGNLGPQKANIAIKLRDNLINDRSVRRFSIISVDGDLESTKKVLREQIRKELIVGWVNVNEPDFEIGNFSVEELVRIAADWDSEEGFGCEALRDANWSDVKDGRDFEERYLRYTRSERSGLKGYQWGERLAIWVMDKPEIEGDGRERPIWKAVKAGLRARVANYDSEEKNYQINPTTFKTEQR